MVISVTEIDPRLKMLLDKIVDPDFVRFIMSKYIDQFYVVYGGRGERLYDVLNNIYNSIISNSNSVSHINTRLTNIENTVNDIVSNKIPDIYSRINELVNELNNAKNKYDTQIADITKRLTDFSHKYDEFHDYVLERLDDLQRGIEYNGKNIEKLNECVKSITSEYSTISKDAQTYISNAKTFISNSRTNIDNINKGIIDASKLKSALTKIKNGVDSFGVIKLRDAIGIDKAWSNNFTKVSTMNVISPLDEDLKYDIGGFVIGTRSKPYVVVEIIDGEFHKTWSTSTWVPFLELNRLAMQAINNRVDEMISYNGANQLYHMKRQQFLISAVSAGVQRAIAEAMSGNAQDRYVYSKSVRTPDGVSASVYIEIGNVYAVHPVKEIGVYASPYIKHLMNNDYNIKVGLETIKNTVPVESNIHVPVSFPLTDDEVNNAVVEVSKDDIVNVLNGLIARVNELTKLVEDLKSQVDKSKCQ